MAGVSDYFSIGSTVACKTCYDKEIEGEVLAFDQQTKMLILSILFNVLSPRSGPYNKPTLRAQIRLNRSSSHWSPVSLSVHFAAPTTRPM
jgi:hypothetical protein